MVKPTYDDAPTAPTRNSPTTFRTRMDAFLAWMPGFKTFVDAANTHVDGQLTAAETARDKAEEWADKAEDSPVETGQFSAKHWAAKADADATATAADRVQTGLDRVATGEDVTSAQTAAAAAGAAAGLPSLTGNAGKALLVNPAADGVLWGVGGGLEPIAKYTVSSAVAAVEFEIPSTGYAQVFIFADGVEGTHADLDKFFMRTSSNGGSSFDALSNYAYRVGAFNSVSDSKFVIAANAEVPGNGFSFELNISRLVASEKTRAFFYVYGSVFNTLLNSDQGMVERTTEDVTDALQFYFESGNITAGTFHVYGMKEGGA